MMRLFVEIHTVKIETIVGWTVYCGLLAGLFVGLFVGLVAGLQAMWKHNCVAKVSKFCFNVTNVITNL